MNDQTSFFSFFDNWKKREKIISEIESIEDETEYQILFSKYITGDTLEKISNDFSPLEDDSITVGT